MPMCVCVFTFLLGAGINFDGVDGSSTGLVFRLFENFLRLRLSAAKAPNPIKGRIICLNWIRWKIYKSK